MDKVLIIEDDSSIREGLKFYLEQEHYEVLNAKDGASSLHILENNLDTSIILLDINLPDMNGFDLFSKLKEIVNIPIIFLTASDLEVSIVRGLDMGADDYITKPFKARELVSRIKTVLRRVNNNSNIINIQNITIDLNQAKVFKNNKDLMLTALEYKILLSFALNPNIVFTREKILADVWDVDEEYVSDNALTVYIKRIREKIEDDPTNPKIIITAKDSVKTEEEIKEALDISENKDNYSVFNVKAAEQQDRNYILFISILLYGFITLVTLIGVTSVFNTINTSIALRRKEFAVLRSIGLTPKGFNKMIRYESLLYGLKSLIIGIPISLVVILFIKRAFNNVVVFENFIPVKPLIICILGVFIITFITMMYSTSKIKKENILDAIREENI